MIIGVPKESYPGERRVALVPAVITNLAKAGFQVVVEAGAGEQAGYPDAFYLDKGAKILPDRASVFSGADIVTQVLCYGPNHVAGKADLPLLRRGQIRPDPPKPENGLRLRSGDVAAVVPKPGSLDGREIGDENGDEDGRTNCGIAEARIFPYRVAGD